MSFRLVDSFALGGTEAFGGLGEGRVFDIGGVYFALGSEAVFLHKLTYLVFLLFAARLYAGKL